MCSLRKLSKKLLCRCAVRTADLPKHLFKHISAIFQAVGESVRRGFVETASRWIFWGERFESSGFFGEKMHAFHFILGVYACTAVWHAYFCMHVSHALYVAVHGVIINSMLIVMEMMRFVLLFRRNGRERERGEIRVKCKRIWSPTTERD